MRTTNKDQVIEIMKETDAAKMLVQSAARSHFYFYWSRQFTLLFAMIGTVISLSIYLVDYDTGYDFARVFTLGMGAYLLGFCSKVVRVYNKLQLVLTGSAGYLPGHIKWMAISYLGLVLVSSCWMVYLIGKSPVVWGMPLTFLSFLAGIYGTGLMWRYELRQASEHGLWNERKTGRK